MDFEKEGRINALRQLISITADELNMAEYASRAGFNLSDMPEMRKGWIAELRTLEGFLPILKTAGISQDERLAVLEAALIEMAGEIYG